MNGKHGFLTTLGKTILIVTALLWTASATVGVEKIGIKSGVCAVLGLPKDATPSFVTELAAGSQLLVYFQSPNGDEVDRVRKAAEAAGMLGRRVFVDQGKFSSIHLANNLAGAILVGPDAEEAVDQKELLRVLHPEGKAIVGDREIVKPVPEGVDSWGHPYHGPDNNPLSTDQLARWPYLTQFLADPLFCPMPEISVAAGGKVYRAFGHISHKANQNAMLNKLICVNGYNGAILWQRDLTEGFMIHRNTLIATPDTLYLADDKSCKLIDPDTGKVKDEIVIPDGVADGVADGVFDGVFDGPVWKWMSLVDGVLYALVGGAETPSPTQRSQTPGMGHWPWGMWAGHDYKNPKTNFGFGRTLLAIDPATKNILWTHREDEYLDSRGVCMKGRRIFVYAPRKFLASIDAKTGKPLWKTDDAELLEAIGSDGRAQLWKTGFSISTYIKADDERIFFAGPQRSRLVVVRADDGKMLWNREHGNYQLVLRDDGFYAAGPLKLDDSRKLSYDGAKELAHLPPRRACTRATGSVDSVFYRASGGTIRIDVASDTAQHIAPMRPACQDGVIISDGLLYWGPWMCGCQLSLYGHICLGPAGKFNFQPAANGSRLEQGGNIASVKPLKVEPGDWPAYRGDSRGSSVSKTPIPRQVKRGWTFNTPSGVAPTAPVTAGGMVFFGDRSGAVHALDADGKPVWQAYTGGAIFFPPTVSDGRLFAGSADGRVYAFEAATGRRLWTYRLAPANRWMPVYGKLISTWPVAGGVVVKNGVVYAAAGIAHYDGTYVAAFDAASGKVKWYNDSSGALSKKANSGVSLQGSLYIDNGALCFVGGGVCEIARYDLATGKCLNEPYDGVNSRFHTAFYPYFPTYGNCLSLDHTLADGKTLTYDASYESSRHSRLELLPPLPPGTSKPVKPASRWGRFGKGKNQPKPVWVEKTGRKFNSFIVGPALLLGAGYVDSDAGQVPFLAAMNLKDGTDLWNEKLPATVVKGGTAIDRAGRIFVALEDGEVVCFQP